MSASFASASYAPDNLLAGDADSLKGRKVTIVSGQNLVRGSVIGKVTASGKYVLSLSAAADGSQAADLILAEAADATAADVSAIAYERGDFNQNALTLGAGHTIASIREGLRGKGIFLFNSVGA